MIDKIDYTSKAEVLRFLQRNWNKKIANQLRKFKVRERDLEDRRSEVFLKLVETDFLKNYNNPDYLKANGDRRNFKTWLNNYLFRVCQCIASNSFRKASRDHINFYVPLEETFGASDSSEYSNKKFLENITTEDIELYVSKCSVFTPFSRSDTPEDIAEKRSNLDAVLKRIRAFPNKAWSKATHERMGGKYMNSYETPFRWLVYEGMSVTMISERTGLTKTRIYDWIDTLRRLVEEAMHSSEEDK